MTSSITRRRFIAISGAAAGLGLLPLHGRAAHGETVTWQGHVLGAVATMRLHHHDRLAAEHLIQKSVAEIRRLESIFSLYRDDSALVQINRTGVLDAPPRDLTDLLQHCRFYHALTGGAFDPTVQPLWNLYRDHFAASGSSPDGPPDAALRSRLEHVGMDKVVFDEDRIVLRKGMSLTLNGIAQGYATDRVVGILRAGGIGASLVDMGEPRAIGARPDGRPWQIGIADPAEPESAAETLDIVDQAVATSGGYGLNFDRAGRFNHLLDPRTGQTAGLYRSVTTIAPTATEADALSTAFSLTAASEIPRMLARLGHRRVILATSEGERLAIQA